MHKSTVLQVLVLEFVCHKSQPSLQLHKKTTAHFQLPVPGSTGAAMVYRGSEQNPFSTIPIHRLFYRSPWIQFWFIDEVSKILALQFPLIGFFIGHHGFNFVNLHLLLVFQVSDPC
jgi:hypothetical protein